jgi:flagellar hook-basal body complex protein FliE
MTIAPIGTLATVQGGLAEPLAHTTRAPEVAPANTGETQAPGAQAAGGGGEGGFSGALGQALNSLEGSQATGEAAAAQVATGSTSNPEGAVVKVMDAELEMQLASQVRAKASEALQTIFQTQV